MCINFDLRIMRNDAFEEGNKITCQMLKQGLKIISNQKLSQLILKQLVNSVRKPGAKFWMSSRQERNLN